MKKQTFIVGVLILTIGGFIAKVIGALYKIPLTNALGSTGMGLYYLVFPLYSLLLVFSSSGVSIAVSKLVSEARANKLKKNETMYFKAGITLSFVSSLLFSILLVIFSGTIASLQGNVLATKGYIAIAPALVSASLIAVVKGYFQGVENMFPSSVAMIFEQVFKLIVGLFLAYRFLKYGVEYAVMGSILAVSISELITLFVMLINYAWHKAKNDYKFYTKDPASLKLKEILPKSKIVKVGRYKVGKLVRFKKRPIWVLTAKNGKLKYVKIKVLYFHNSNENITFFTAIKQTLHILVPTTLSSFVLPAITLVDSFLVINILVSSGVSSYTATSLYGLSNGVVSALISLPVILTSAMASSMMPNLSGIYSVGRVQETTDRSAFYIKITFVLVLPIFVYFISFAPDIISALYNLSDNGVISEFSYTYKLLIVASVGIIYNAFLSTFVSIMQVIGKPFKVFYVMLLAFALRMGLMILLLNISSVNIFGVVISNVVFYLLCDIVCVVEIKKTLDLQFNFLKSFVCPIIASVVSAGCVFVTKHLTKNINIWLNLAIGGVVCIVVYFVLIWTLKCFSLSEKKYLPFNRVLKNKNKIWCIVLFFSGNN